MEHLVNFGSAVKDLGDGRIGGHLVIFSTAADPDLSRQYFTKSTEFDVADGDTTPVLYHHGLDPLLKRRKLGVGTLKTDDVGIWVETQLALRDRYEAKIYEMVKAGKLGWSSGSAPHLVEVKKVGGDVEEIVSWPLGLDASLTPTPCEPRTCAVTLKSLPPAIPLEELVGNDGAAAGAAKTSPAEEAPHGGLTLHAHVEAALAAAETAIGLLGDATARLETITEDRTIKAGRPGSATNRGRVEDLTAAGDAVVARLAALKAAMEPREVAPAVDTATLARQAYASFLQTEARLSGVDV